MSADDNAFITAKPHALWCKYVKHVPAFDSHVRDKKGIHDTLYQSCDKVSYSKSSCTGSVFGSS